MAEETKTRRAFVRGAAQVAVTAPAVAMLLNTTTVQAAVSVGYAKVGDDSIASFADDSFVDDTFITPGDDTSGAHGSS